MGPSVVDARAAAEVGLGVRAALAFALAGCGPSDEALARALDSAQPHLEHFAEFDGWTRRARPIEAALGSRAALDETVFAKARGDSAVLAAWIDLRRRVPERLAMPAGAELPASLRWVLVRTRELGPVQVAVQQPCAVPGRAGRGARHERCVLIQREQPSAPGETLVVTVAYRGERRE